MLYLKRVSLCSAMQEEMYLNGSSESYSDSFYPFQIFPQKQLRCIDFAPITLLGGGNGSGKTTALNIIAELLRAHRHTPFNSSDYFPAI